MNFVATYKKAKKRYGVFLLNQSAANLQRISQWFPEWGYPRYLRGLCLLTLGKTVAADQTLREAIARDPRRAHAHYLLGLALSKKSKWWQAVAAFEAAVEGAGKHARWHYELGKARERMKRFDKAAEAFGDAVALKPGRSVWQYRLGRAMERAGDLAGAEKAYAKATRLDASGQLRRLGTGAWHQKDGLWALALASYLDRVRLAPNSAELRFRVGFAQERAYRWDLAAASYRRALALAPNAKADWHYRLGFVLERQQKWREAAQAYNAAIVADAVHRPYRNYRLGYVLSKAGDHRAACSAYLNVRKNVAYAVQIPEHLSLRDRDNWMLRIAHLTLRIEANTTDENLHLQLARAHEAIGEWEAAARACQDALLRCSSYKPDWYYRLGRALMRAGSYEKACAAFAETVAFRLPHGVDAKKYKTVDVTRALAYAEYYETLPVEENVIVYESFHGANMSCNPYAMFRQIVDDPRYRSWLHVWALNDRRLIPPEYRTRANVVFVTRESDRYRRYLASAKYLINNNTFPPYFVRREEQRYLFTWHGTPLKTLGKDMRTLQPNAARNMLQATHLLSPNAHTSRILLESHDVAGCFPGKMLEAGYPRVDATLNLTQSARLELRERLGLSNDRPVVLYAPTWRGELGKEQTEVSRMINDLARLRTLPCQLLFKGHHLVEKKLAEKKIASVPGSIDTNELLSIVDILITDYSSIFFDFIPTRRPIVYYTYDYEEYSTQRGLYFGFEDMPGSQCFDIDALSSTLAGLIGRWPEYDEDHASAAAKFCMYDDGQATQRAMSFFFDDEQTGKVITARSERPRLLFYNFFDVNGITSSFISLINKLARDGRYDIAVAMDHQTIDANPACRAALDALDHRVPILGRTGAMVATLEERDIVDRFYDPLEAPIQGERKEIHARAFRREYRRLFGESHFDLYVAFEGYNLFWMSLFAEAGTSDIGRIVYLHNNMLEESKVRFPKLEALFSLYRQFDDLVSVSDSVHEANLTTLAPRLGIDAGRFAWLNNLIDTDRILALAEEPVDPTIETWIGDARVIATAARLSPEKGQEKLIRAFATVRKTIPDIKLMLIGDGPLRAKLEGLVREMGAGEYVRFAGRHANPFPLMRRADSFILSSDHEGQGLVLLEALTLGKQVVSTDIPGPHSVLEGGYGLLVENSESGVVHGLTELLNGWTAPKRFDAQQYQADALRNFIALIERHAPVRLPVPEQAVAQAELA
ncbi:CDP-glycerol glycerophosphotransferase family protein [Caballeronia sp. J97]|uniref:CDP-glycerol glycerophosphotransferase family protein n=1 Tax=Caballeronia sp. J97 TaxID=2805429 RepID=UPI002AB2BFA2|nr:CDP-glycerol glycerophosphotransferase family protein [Caballeronia sp. J97]